MVEPVFQVLGAPNTHPKSSEEGERGGKVAADMNRPHEIRLAKLGRHIALKVRIPVRAAKDRA